MCACRSRSTTTRAAAPYGQRGARLLRRCRTWRSIEAPVTPRRVDRHDVGVVKLGQHRLLSEKSGLKRPRQMLVPLPDGFDRDPAIQGLLDRLVDFPSLLPRSGGGSLKSPRRIGDGRLGRPVRQ